MQIWWHPTLFLGAVTNLGWNMPITHCATPPWSLSPFQAQVGYSPPLFPETREESGGSHLLTPLSRGVEQCGDRFELRWYEPPPARELALTDIAIRCPLFRWVRGDLLLRVESCKLIPLYIGPFMIICKINPVLVRLKLPASMCILPTFHISRLKPVLVSVLAPVDRGTTSALGREWWPGVHRLLDIGREKSGKGGSNFCGLGGL